MRYKLGKLPARPGAVKLQFSDYVDTTKLPPLPPEFGHENLVTDWGMLGNDKVSDCVIAGGLHETMLWNKEAGKTVAVDTDCAIKNYENYTGYNPDAPPDARGDNPTDTGTDVADAAKLRRTQGLLDANGNVHRIGIYLALQPGNLTELDYATWLFDGVGIGVRFPREWDDAFDNGKPWDVLQNPTMDGGHYVPCVAKRGGLYEIITWGKSQALTAAGDEQFNDETLAYASQEKLLNGKDLDGLNWSQMAADLTAVTQL